jgi:hypothetical protein
VQLGGMHGLIFFAVAMSVHGAVFVVIAWPSAPRGKRARAVSGLVGSGGRSSSRRRRVRRKGANASQRPHLARARRCNLNYSLDQHAPSALHVEHMLGIIDDVATTC